LKLYRVVHKAESNQIIIKSLTKKICTLYSEGVQTAARRHVLCGSSS